MTNQAPASPAHPVRTGRASSVATIEGIGAKRDGVLRHHATRRDGTVRDTVMFSILATEWPDVRRHLDLRLSRHS